MKAKFYAICTRIYELICKNISIKAEIFFIATVLMIEGKIEPWQWSFFAAGFAGLRTLEKFIGCKENKIEGNKDDSK